MSRAKTDEKAGDAGFRYWLNIADELKPGNQARAKSSVIVTHLDSLHGDGRELIQLQFWFFYAFNGPGKFHLRVGEVFSQDVEMDTAGRHYGDWEHVTLELKPAGQDWQLSRVYLSRHDLTVWITHLSLLQFEGEHPKIYVARDSHAHYERPGKHNYKRVAHESFFIGHLDVDLYDLTNDGYRFETAKPSNYVIISSDYDEHHVRAPAWTNFEKRWGQYERLVYTYEVPVFGIDAYTFKSVESGPLGPKQHGNPPGSDVGWPARSGVGAMTVDKRPYAFVIGTDGHLGINFSDGPTWQWSDQGVPAGGLAADGVGVTTVDGRPYAFVRSVNGHLWTNWWDGRAWHWSDQGVPADGLAAGVGVTTVDGRPYAFVRSPNGHLGVNWWDGRAWHWTAQGSRW